MQITDEWLRLDPAAPFGYDLASDIFYTPGANLAPLPDGPPMPRCQVLLGTETPASPACPPGPATVEQYREIAGQWTPFGIARYRPTNPSGPTTMALLNRPVTAKDRIPEDLYASLMRIRETMPPGDAPIAINDPAALAQARLAGTANSRTVWAVPGTNGQICILAGRPGGGSSASCGSDRQLASSGLIPLTSTERGVGTKLWALVADGYTSAVINGADPVPIRNNFLGASSTRTDESTVVLRGPGGPGRSTCPEPGGAGTKGSPGCTCSRGSNFAYSAGIVAQFDVAFAEFHNQQSWCGNTGSIVQNMWCDMWAVGSEMKRTKRARRWGTAAAAMAIAVAGGTLPVPAILSANQTEPHPTHKNPITGTPLPDTGSGDPQVIAERNGVKYVISQGRGTAAEMLCFSRATAEMTMTGCDRPEALAKRGFVLAEDLPGGIRVDAYLPLGIDRVEANGRILPVINRLFTATLDTPQASLLGKGSAGQELPMGTSGTPTESRNR